MNINCPKYIEEYDNALESDFCDDVINKFENEKNKNKGITSNGYNENVKKTIDFYLYNNISEWKDIDDVFCKSLDKLYLKYYEKYKEFQIFKLITDSGFQIQKYIANDGYYTYHQDFMFNETKSKYRILTYLYYLNDVYEGGETEFLYGEYKIKPKKGKCVLFPSLWTFPHTGLMPISNDKYIVTGWFYASTIV